MKAAVVRLPTSLESLSIEDQAEPAITAGKLKVRWHALSLNFHDYAVVAGMLPAVDGRIPISDGAGEIVAVGEGVSGWAVGDKVMSLFFPDWQDGEPTAATTSRLGGDSTDGCAVEFSLVDPDKLTRIPKGYSFAEAATLPCAALTAWRALVEVGQIKAGDQVLVEGTGGVSIFALQFAKSFGAKVYATSSSPAKLERLKKLGADATIDYRADPNWGEAISQLSGGGVDHVIDVGGAATLDQSISAVKVGGSLVIIGILGGLVAEINLAKLMMKQQQIRPIAVGSRAMQLRMVEAIEKSGMKPIIDARFPLGKLADAFRYQLSGQHFGKIVIDID